MAEKKATKMTGFLVLVFLREMGFIVLALCLVPKGESKEKEREACFISCARVWVVFFF
jgi:hypothetical protein